MKIKELYKLFQAHPAISTDTRKIKPNSIFFALKGENFDGNDFASKALESGSEIAVVDKPEIAVDDRYFLVGNVLDTLQQLANEHRKKLGLPILGITGTNGKTTTKELIAAVLSKKYNTHFTQGNFNNHIGVPLTLLEMKRETEIGVVEMGASHPGEIAALCKIVLPDYGLITNVGKAHLEGFGTFDGVKQTKAELYRSIEKKKGKIFINLDNNILDELAGPSLERVGYGISAKAFLQGGIVESNPFLKLYIRLANEELSIQTKLVGAYNFENALAAACVGKYFNIEPLDIKTAIEEYSPDNNRSQFIRKGSNQIVMDAYNANPTSMQTSIKNFLSLDSSNKILILGDMLELGSDSQSEHQRIADLLKDKKVKLAFIVGENFESTRHSSPIRSFRDTGSLIKFLKENPITKSLILIKGSRGIRLERVLDVIN